MRIAAALVIGFIIDVIIGDPDYPFHPVILMGKMIGFLEKHLRRLFSQNPCAETAAGGVMVVMVTLVWYYLGYVGLGLADRLNTYVSFAFECLVCYQCMAVKSMMKESRNVLENIKTGDISKARSAVKRIVGRDTGCLDMAGVIKADVECVAESLCDGVIAPMFWMAVGGVPLMLMYKAVNTMDSMTAYKNSRYFYFGKTAARLDDIANLIPSRIAAFLIITGVWVRGRFSVPLLWVRGRFSVPHLCKQCNDGHKTGTEKHTLTQPAAGAFRIWKRDRYKHSSPNSGQTEAAMAGALGIRLGGNASYFGEMVEKPYIGDDIRPPEEYDIIRANQIFRVASVLGLIVFAGVRALIYVNCIL